MSEIAQNIEATLDRYIKPQSLIVLKKCLENAIFMKIKYRQDIIQFITYIKTYMKPLRNETTINRTINTIIKKINNIIEKAPSNYEELIEKVYDDELGKYSNEIRFNYSMSIILPYVQKLLNLPSMEQLKRNIYSLRLNDEDLIESLNTIFKQHTGGRDYDYFRERYDKVIGTQRVTHLFNKWKAPKFIIMHKVQSKMQTERRQQTTRIGGDDEATLPLRKMHRNVVQSTDKTLQSDKDKIMRILNILNNDGVKTAQDFWENNMYEYIRKRNKHPRTEERNALIAVTCWIHEISRGNDKRIEDVINTANDLGYETGSTVQSAMGLYNEMFTVAKASVYKKSFLAKFSSYPIPIENIKQFLDSKLESIESIENIIDTLNSSPPPKTKKEREDKVYDLLKPIKSLKITRQIVQSLLAG
jgi:hypothetical protein